MDSNKYLELSDRTCKHIPAEGVVIDPKTYDLMHAAIGISGEAGEFLDSVKKTFIYNKPFDVEHAKEEIGDILWYISLALRTMDVSFEQVMEENINKLSLRYPDKYSDQAAQERADKK